MKLQQAKIILEKINRLYQSMTLDENVDVFEKELMLSYIRQLYSAFSPGDKLDAKPAKAAIPVAPPEPKPAAPKLVKPKPSPPPPPPKPEPEPEPVKPVVAMPEPPKSAPVVKPVVEATPEPSKPEPLVTAEVEEKVTVAPKSTKPAAVPKPVLLKKEPPKASPKPANEEHEVLFEQQEATDLGEKLSQRPIKDLKKAMGINEKILTVKELFNGDQKLFDDTMGILNGFSNFEQAKEFLTTNIASEQGWTSKEKRKKARIFIKLVRRRYK